jgi:hypothetical protein
MLSQLTGNSPGSIGLTVRRRSLLLAIHQLSGSTSTWQTRAPSLHDLAARSGALEVKLAVLLRDVDAAQARARQEKPRTSGRTRRAKSSAEVPPNPVSGRSLGVLSLELHSQSLQRVCFVGVRPRTSVVVLVVGVPRGSAIRAAHVTNDNDATVMAPRRWIEHMREGSVIRSGSGHRSLRSCAHPRQAQPNVDVAYRATAQPRRRRHTRRPSPPARRPSTKRQSRR